MNHMRRIFYECNDLQATQNWKLLFPQEVYKSLSFILQTCYGLVYPTNSEKFQNETYG